MSLTMRQICLVAAELKPAIHDLKTILGVEVCYVDPHVDIFDVENSFKCTILARPGYFLR